MKKIVPVLLLVAVIALMFATPVFALDGAPPVEKPVFDMVAISQALQALVLAVVVPLAGFAARWLLAQGNFAKSQLTEQQLWVFDTFLKTLVYAAEQINLKGEIFNKFDWVQERADEWLTKYQIDMDFDELRARIEAIVAQELNMHKILPEPAAG